MSGDVVTAPVYLLFQCIFQSAFNEAGALTSEDIVQVHVRENILQYMRPRKGYFREP